MSIDQVIRSVDEQISKLQQARAALNGPAQEKQRAEEDGRER
jgi:hypothetical protein